MVLGKHGNLVCIKLRLEEGAFDGRTQRKLQGKRLGFHDFLTVFFAFVCAFPFQHSYAFRHDQLYHSFNVFFFILKGIYKVCQRFWKYILFIHNLLLTSYFPKRQSFIKFYCQLEAPCILFIYFRLLFSQQCVWVLFFLASWRSSTAALNFFFFKKDMHIGYDGCPCLVRRMCNTPQVIRNPKGSLFLYACLGSRVYPATAMRFVINEQHL